tara:strand:+ start:320 stop:571 length:252 start_codon:yes stop_codon:yes gene_type:complete
MRLATETDFELFGDCANHLEVMNSHNDFYVIMKTVFRFGNESLERSSAVDSEIFKSYEHARRHALSMIRKFGKFEDIEFRGSN